MLGVARVWERDFALMYPQKDNIFTTANIYSGVSGVVNIDFSVVPIPMPRIWHHM